MLYTAILKQIRLLVPAKPDEHYESIRLGFEDGTLTAPAYRSRKCNWLEQFRNSLAFLQRSVHRDPAETFKSETLTCLPSNLR
jgi:hypothetical protein